jgi:hypothetical protein
VVEISFVRAKWWCEEGWIYVRITGREMGGEQGDLLFGSASLKRGSLEFNGNCSSGESSVGMYKLKEVMEEFCSDLMAAHQWKCVWALAGMATWRLFSHRKVMESLLMGTGY